MVQVLVSTCFWCKHDVEVDLVVGTVDGTAVGRGSCGMFGGVDDQAVLDAEYRVGRQVLVARDEDVRDQGAVPRGVDLVVQVRGPHRAAVGGSQQIADRSVVGNRIGRG